MDAWVDGTRTHSFSGIMWRPAGAAGNISFVQWEPIWGGGQGVIQQEQYQYMDHIYLSGK